MRWGLARQRPVRQRPVIKAKAGGDHVAGSDEQGDEFPAVQGDDLVARART